MGYKPFQATVPVDFAGTVFEGAEVNLRTGLTIGKTAGLMREIVAMDRESQERTRARAEAARDGTSAPEPEDDEPMLQKQIGVLGDHIVASWNFVDEDDRPLPATKEGLMQLPISLASYLINEWMRLVWAVRLPLPGSRPAPDSEG